LGAKGLRLLLVVRAGELIRVCREPGELARLNHYDVWNVPARGGMGVGLKARDTKLH
jgi:hypothetical protein